MRANQRGHDFIRQTFSLIHSLVHQAGLVSQHAPPPAAYACGDWKSLIICALLHPLVQGALCLCAERRQASLWSEC